MRILVPNEAERILEVMQVPTNDEKTDGMPMTKDHQMDGGIPNSKTGKSNGLACHKLMYNERPRVANDSNHHDQRTVQQSHDPNPLGRPKRMWGQLEN